MNAQPNPLAVAWSIARARRTRRPKPTGDGLVQSNEFAEVLSLLRTDGIAVLPSERGVLARFRYRMEEVDPDALSVDGALSFWLNLYNAGALALAADALSAGEATVLRLPGAFDTPWAMVGGESLSLNDIEHGKIRRFKDPRIHAALVCGSVSCPSLRYEPFGAAGPYRSATPSAGGAGPKFVFQQVPEPPPAGKNRLHVDIIVGDEIEAEMTRLEALGATRVTELIEEVGTAWIVLGDPEGNEFCLVYDT